MKIGQRLVSVLVFVVLFSGALAAVLFATLSTPSEFSWLTFGVLAILALLAQLFDLLNPFEDQHIQRPTVIFFFAGMLLLHPLLFAVLVFIPEPLVWLKVRRGGDEGANLRSKELFQPAIHIIAGLTSSAIFAGINPAPAQLISPLAILAASAAVLNYAVVYQVLSALTLLVVTRVTLPESGLFSIENLLFGFVMLSLGFVVAVLWQFSPWLILPALPQLVLVYRALKIPQLRQQAQIDVKTGLWTARHLNTLFAAEVKRAARFGRPLALIMADLDFLRVINNTYGHLSGDAVLASVGQTMREALREYDVAGRFGGEEFAIVLPETAEAEAAVIAERIRQAVAARPIKVPTSRTPVYVTMSLGIACFPEGGANAFELMNRADVAVYEAKLKGRNCVVTGSEAAVALLQEGGSARSRMMAGAPTRGRELVSAPGVDRGWDLVSNSRLLPELQRFFPSLPRWGRRLSLATILAVLLLGCVLFLGALGVLGAAARTALPGEALYPLKTAYESAQLAAAATPAERARLHTSFARTRVEEALAFAARDKYSSIPSALSAYEQEMQSASDALLTLPAQDYADRVLVASYQAETLFKSSADLNSLLATSPDASKARVGETVGLTNENIGIARRVMADAASSAQGTSNATKVAVAVPTLTPRPAATAVGRATHPPVPTEPPSALPTAPAPPSTSEAPRATIVPPASNTVEPSTVAPSPTDTPPLQTPLPQASSVPPATAAATQVVPTAPAPGTPSGQETCCSPTQAPAPTQKPATSVPPMLWSADMETEDLSQWALPGPVLAANRGGGEFDEQSGSVSVTDKVAHGGRYSIQMTIDDGGGVDQAVRLFRWHENPIQAYYSVWYMFPQTYTPGSWWNVMQFKSKADYPKDTLWVLNVGNRPGGEMYFYLFDWQQRETHEQTLRDIPVGQWVHIEVLYRRSTATSGRIAVWQDGVGLFDLKGVQTSTAGDVQWSVDNYTDRISPSPATIYADDAAISTRRVGQ